MAAWVTAGCGPGYRPGPLDQFTQSKVADEGRNRGNGAHKQENCAENSCKKTRNCFSEHQRIKPFQRTSASSFYGYWYFSMPKD